MAQITTLKDNEGKTLYPVTSTRAVFDGNGVDLETRLQSEKESAQAALNGKVSIEPGKGLSSNDYTEGDRQKLAALPMRAALTGELDAAGMALLVDMFNAAAGEYGHAWIIDGVFDAELNGVTGITQDEAIRMLEYYSPTKQTDLSYKYIGCPCRTLFTIYPRQGAFSMSQAFQWSALAVIRFEMYYVYNVQPNAANYAFHDAKNLKRILGIMDVSNTTYLTTAFMGCSALEEVSLLYLKSDINFGNSPKLSYYSLSYMILNAANTKAITITVHPDVYAKLTGDVGNEACAALSDEEKEQWTSLVATALSKNIAFATA